MLSNSHIQFIKFGALFLVAGKPDVWRIQMQGPQRELWLELCIEAAREQDPNKLLALIKEINRLLEEKRARLAMETQPGSPTR
jgi:hypothetical protein